MPGERKKKDEKKEEVQTVWKFESQNKITVIIFCSKPPVEGNAYVKNRSLGLSGSHISSEHQFPLLPKDSPFGSTTNKDSHRGQQGNLD